MNSIHNINAVSDFVKSCNISDSKAELLTDKLHNYLAGEYDKSDFYDILIELCNLSRTKGIYEVEDIDISEVIKTTPEDKTVAYYLYNGKESRNTVIYDEITNSFIIKSLESYEEEMYRLKAIADDLQNLPISWVWRDDEGLPIRLRLFEGQLSLHWGDPSYDTDHRGVWASTFKTQGLSKSETLAEVIEMYREIKASIETDSFDDERMSQYLVDIPSVNKPGEYETIASFATKEEAIAYAKENFGSDKNGMISLISEV